jgi:peptide/nickel transport system substrate-binding protein
MTRGRRNREFELSRREFLVTTGGTLAGMAAFGLAGPAAASKRHPQRGGTLQYGPHVDVAGLDPHIQNQNHIHQATAAMYNGLTDIDQRGNIVPSIAESWEANKELTAWTFRLRKGVLFHNGRELDAEAVKLNLMRIKDPAIGHEFLRGALDTIDSVEILDKYTVRLHASMPDVSVPVNVMRYPTVLQAPDAPERDPAGAL